MISASDLSRLLAAATKGPWRHVQMDNVIDTPNGLLLWQPRSVDVEPATRDANAALIVALVNLAPEIAALVEIAEAAREYRAKEISETEPKAVCDCYGKPMGAHYETCPTLPYLQEIVARNVLDAALAKRDRGQG